MNESVPMALLVEDDVEIRRFMRAALEDDGWHVREAATLAHALAGTRDEPPDLIVLDLGMPDGDGVDFIKQVRLRSHVPVIVLTARVDDSETMRAMRAGADDYLTKLFGIGARFNAALRRLRPQPPQPQHGECQ
jgi:two-component system KDP operon response regulator KdpE